MTAISVQVSLYGLGSRNTSEAIAAFQEVLDAHALAYKIGSMSTVIWGENDAVWLALKRGYEAAAALGPVVMHTTISNACPLPEAGKEMS